MANQWLRLWHDMPNDPKWRTIARRSGEPVSLVLAVYLHLLVDASQNVTRGHVDVTAEDLASALDADESQIEAVLDAMDGRVVESGKLTGWDKRQVKREDSGSPEGGAMSAAERKRAQRERERIAKLEQESQQRHAESRKVTTDKEEDKDKDKRNKKPKSGSGEPNAPKAKKYSDWDFETAEYFYQTILTVQPDLKKPNLESWADSVRLMRERDNRSPDDIRAVWSFARADSFWQQNILSAGKLREKYDQLKAKMRAPNHAAHKQPNQPGLDPNDTSWINELYENGTFGSGVDGPSSEPCDQPIEGDFSRLDSSPQNTGAGG
ncbi:hypothetical protein [Gilvimarinus chinensis]|uniref:hypothetical protein n=1 Tax=Gilvimarinus chinensis TaxID=396005 RepID=UPI00036A18CD|nr:hypothetical protein [Gilvimarinus chinensis]